MRILSPFSKPSEVPALIGAGARELYCGVVPREWERKFTYVGSANLRHDKEANLSSFAELKSSVKIASRSGVPVFVALNSHFYSEAQMPLAIKLAGKAVSAGAESLIISDPALVMAVREKFPRVSVSISTAQPCFNGSALGFFKRLGAGRIVLPRHLTVQEITRLAAHAKRQKIGLECFVLNAICPFIDGLCTFQHIVEPSQPLEIQPLACRARYDISVLSRESPEKKAVAAAHAGIFGGSYCADCGLCAIPFLLKAGVGSVKIAGRANPLEKKISDILAVKEAISLAKRLQPKKFAAEAEMLFFDLFKRTCQCKNCYYPDAGKWGK